MRCWFGCTFAGDPVSVSQLDRLLRLLRRFYVNATYFNASAPLAFIEIGGEGPCTSYPTGFIASLAQQHGALLVSLEHRFYGGGCECGSMCVWRCYCGYANCPTLRFLWTCLLLLLWFSVMMFLAVMSD